MLYNFISFLGKEDIDTIGTCIYTGILTDSGSFDSGTTGNTHRVLAVN
jgi:phosphoesterase RecJ-like protein